MGEKEDQEFESLEQEVFKALDHQKRRDILRYVGEKKATTFTEILSASKYLIVQLFPIISEVWLPS
ncbi:MAG: hypothetical protein QMD13_01075 [Candidatus Bathyarchaeia archaeon]|nr:hypothetical protein [Candidatus Bathyarchaeia archaeon]MDI6904075.1 hypothetical protein [Candidatus Bathyarchaeia archaeon]